MSERNYDLAKGGVKFDQDKPEWSLLPIKPCLEGVIRVLMLGAKKYTRDNWRAGMSWSRVLDACKRHILAWEEGEDLDKETSLNHIDHALCEMLFLRYYIEKGLGVDDRYQPTPAERGLVFTTGTGAPIISKNTFEELVERYKHEPSPMSHEDIEGDKNYWGV